MNTKDHYQSTPAFTSVGAHDTEAPVAATVVARLANPLGATATMVNIQPIGQSINYTLDGTVPTAATLGFFVAAGDGVTIPMPPGNILTIIENAAAPAAVVQVQWGR